MKILEGSLKGTVLITSLCCAYSVCLADSCCEEKLTKNIDCKGNKLFKMYMDTQEPPATDWEVAGFVKSVVKAGQDTGNLATAVATVLRKPKPCSPFGVYLKAGVGNSKHRHTQAIVNADEYHHSSYGSHMTTNNFSGFGILPLDRCGKVTLNIGRFSSWMGMENTDDGFPTVTGSVLGAMDCVPSFHHGGFLNFDCSENLKAKLSYVNGWNENLRDKNHHQSGGSHVRILPTDSTAIGLSAYFGKEGAPINPEKPNQRSFGGIQFPNPGNSCLSMYNAYISQKVSCDWKLGIDAFTAHSKSPNKGKWYGGGIYTMWIPPNSRFKVVGRVDFFNDVDGLVAAQRNSARQLVGTKGSSSSVGVRYKVSNKQELRGEVKYLSCTRPILPGKEKHDWRFTIVQVHKI